jgi:hypothetical protein
MLPHQAYSDNLRCTCTCKKLIKHVFLVVRCTAVSHTHTHTHTHTQSQEFILFSPLPLGLVAQSVARSFVTFKSIVQSTKRIEFKELIGPD